MMVDLELSDINLIRYVLIKERLDLSDRLERVQKRLDLPLYQVEERVREIYNDLGKVSRALNKMEA